MPASSRCTTHAPALDPRFDVPLRGVSVDAATRCAHYDGPHDIIALRHPCCGVYYPCHKCHRAVTRHDAERWPRSRWEEPAVLCGACGTTITAAAYLRSDPFCRHCGAAFNPGCAAHRPLYFDVDE
ncbi:MAG: CHY zinc finger protein [Salinivenus sp.]